MANRDKQMKKKSKFWIQIITIAPYLMFFCALLIGFIVIKTVTLEITVRYESRNLPTASESISAEEPPLYNYYLDASPSMLGYSTESGKMGSIAQALVAISGTTGTYYTCADKVSAVSVSDFLRYMTDKEPMSAYYQRSLTNSSQTGDENQESLRGIIENIDLSKIFTEQHDNGQSFSMDATVTNVILTDLNFLKNSLDTDGQRELLNRFAGYLATNAADSNICVYNIPSSHIGSSTDEYDPTDISNKNYSFFVIILTKDDEAYKNFIGNLESNLKAGNITAAQKYELRNNPADGNSFDKVNLKSEPLLLQTKRSDLNWDNLSFKNLPENAVGLRMLYNDTNAFASIQMPVAPISLPGYYKTLEDWDSYTDEIETVIEVYESGFVFGSAKKYTASNVVRNPAAYLRSIDGEWYLFFEVSLSKNAAFSAKIHKTLLLDVRFSLAKPRYPIPAWVDEMDASSSLENGGAFQIAGLRDLFSQLGAAKESLYIRSANDAKGYLGNLLLLVNY